MKLILFSSYSKYDIPDCVFHYLSELKKLNIKIIFLTNKRTIPNIDKLNLEYYLYDNEGYDFGMYYKYLLNNDITEVDQLYLINDSMELFGDISKFKFINNVDTMVSFTDSNEVKYHLQSYFWVLNKNIIPLFINYLKKHKIINDYNNVVKTYEIGFSQYLLKKDKKLLPLFKSKDNLNQTIFYMKDLYENGFPLIKKKLLYGFNNMEVNYLKLMNFDFTFDYKKLIYKI